MKLPMPPSTNNLFVNIPKRGRVPSARYKAWKTAAGLTLNVQRPPAVSGSVDVSILVPQKTRGDIDNRIKAILDLLVTHRVIEDDSKIAALIVRRHPNVAPDTVEVIAFPSAKEAA